MDLHADLRGWRVAQKRLADEAVIARENARIYAPSRRIHALVEQSNAIQRGRVPITGKETIFFKTDDRLMVETRQDREQPMSREMSGGNGILDMYGWHQGKGVDQLERTIAIQSGISQKYKKVFAKAPEVVPYMGELAEPPESDIPIERALRDLKNNKSPYKPDQDGTFFDWNDGGDGGDGAAIEVEDDGGGAVGEADPNGLGAVGAAAALGGAVGNAVVVLPPQIQQQARDAALAGAAGLDANEGGDAAQQAANQMAQQHENQLPPVGNQHFDPFGFLRQMEEGDAGPEVDQYEYEAALAREGLRRVGQAVGNAAAFAGDVALAPVRGVRAAANEVGRVAGQVGRVAGRVAGAIGNVAGNAAPYVGQAVGAVGRAAQYVGPILGREARRIGNALAPAYDADYYGADLNGGFQGQEQVANVAAGPPPPPPGGGGGQIQVGDVNAAVAVNQAREEQENRRRADAAAAAQPPAQNAMAQLQRNVQNNDLMGGYVPPPDGLRQRRAGANAAPEPPAAARPGPEVDASLAGLLPRARANVAAMPQAQQNDLLRRAAAGAAGAAGAVANTAGALGAAGLAGVAGLARGAYGAAAGAVGAAAEALATAQEEARQRRLARKREAENERVAQIKAAAIRAAQNADRESLERARAARVNGAAKIAARDRAEQQDALAEVMEQVEADRADAARADAAANAQAAAAVAAADAAGPQVPNAAPAAGVQRGLPANVPGMQGRQQGVVHPPAGFTMASGARNALGLKKLYELIEGKPLPPEGAFDTKGNFARKDLQEWWIMNSTSPEPDIVRDFFRTLSAVDQGIDAKSNKKYRTHNNMGGKGKPHGSDKRKRSASLSGSEKGEKSGEVMVKKKRKGRWPAGSQEARDEMARIRAMRKT